MNNSPTLAIDFGTSRTKVAYFDEDNNRAELVELGHRVTTMIPSVFYVPPPDKGAILVGEEAEDMSEEDPQGYVVAIKKEIHKSGSRRLGVGRKIDRIELVSHLFRHIKGFTEKHIPYFMNRKADSCILTVPVSFSGIQREAIRKAAELGGFSEIKVVEEPVAAAQAWLAESSRQGVDAVVVCDIGGGTTDFAVVRCQHGFFQPVPDIPTKGFDWGGDNLDESILEHLHDEDEEANTDKGQGLWSQVNQWRGAFKTRIRRIKESFSRNKKESYGTKIRDTELPVSRSAVEHCIEKFTDQVVDELDQYLKTCRERLNKKDLPVLLVGGSSRLPNLEEKVVAIAGKSSVFRWSRSDYAIVLGATLEDRTIIPPAEEEPLSQGPDPWCENHPEAQALLEKRLSCEEDDIAPFPALSQFKTNCVAEERLLKNMAQTIDETWKDITKRLLPQKHWDSAYQRALSGNEELRQQLEEYSNPIPWKNKLLRQLARQERLIRQEWAIDYENALRKATATLAESNDRLPDVLILLKQVASIFPGSKTIRTVFRELEKLEDFLDEGQMSQIEECRKTLPLWSWLLIWSTFNKQQYLKFKKWRFFELIRYIGICIAITSPMLIVCLVIFFINPLFSPAFLEHAAHAVFMGVMLHVYGLVDVWFIWSWILFDCEGRDPPYEKMGTIDAKLGKAMGPMSISCCCVAFVFIGYIVALSSFVAKDLITTLSHSKDSLIIGTAFIVSSLVLGFILWFSINWTLHAILEHLSNSRDCEDPPTPEVIARRKKYFCPSCGNIFKWNGKICTSCNYEPVK